MFTADVSSLYTIKQLLETKLPGILIVECFNLNLVCDSLIIKSYPVVFFARYATSSRVIKEGSVLSVSCTGVKSLWHKMGKMEKVPHD